MKIHVKILAKWTALKSPGDADKLALQANGQYSADTFNRAFREGKCSDEVFKLMADFYEEKAKLIKEYL